MSLSAPRGYGGITEAQIRSCLANAEKEYKQAQDPNSSYHIYKGWTKAQALNHFLNSKGIYTDCFAPTRDSISVSDAIAVAQHYTQEKFENDIINGRYRVSRSQADEIMRNGSDKMKAAVLAMNGNYTAGSGASGSYDFVA